MTDEGSASKLRLTAKANGRLLKGYGPLAALLVAFLLMAMLVPTKAPQQDVVSESQGTGAGAAGAANTSGAAGAAGGAGTAAGAAGAAGGAAAGAAAWRGRRQDGRLDGAGGARQVGRVPGSGRAGSGRSVLSAVHLVFRQ